MSDPDLEPKAATPRTIAVNARSVDGLDFDDPTDAQAAAEGRCDTRDPVIVKAADGRVIWNLPAYDFLSGDGPLDTINPSLLRQARLNLEHGLFRVAAGAKTDFDGITVDDFGAIYQVRGYDLANVSFVRGRTGWVVIDPLTAEETCAAALDLLYDTLGDRAPISALIFTHSHVDHYGGVHGLFPGGVPDGLEVWAPEGFLEHAVSENVIAGNAMNRRAVYMYGNLLAPGPQGQVDAGLGKATAAGRRGILAATRTITAADDGVAQSVDGLTVEFAYTPDTEAPAEMVFFFADTASLCMAENATHTLHNLYTLRGAQVRDALGWSKDLNAIVDRYGTRAERVFMSHHWPVTGEAVVPFLTRQRDLYRYLHDQTLRLANRGYTMTEIAERIRLPKPLAAEFDCRGYYGTVSHNVKAVYQRYLGWYDANPAHLHPHPPQEASVRYVRYMGGADAVLARAREDFARGDYRWVAEVVDHVVFAEPDNMEARALQADTLEQLGYQSESAPWRNVYLSGAYELRHGVPEAHNAGVNPDYLAALGVDQILDYVGVHVGEDAEGLSLAFNVVVTGDPGASGPVEYRVGLENGAINYSPDRRIEGLTTYTFQKGVLVDLVTGAATVASALADGQITVDGDGGELEALIATLDRYDGWFDIVTP